MSGIRMVFVEKKAGFNVESQILLKDFKDNLGIEALEDVRVLNKYILGDMEEEQYVRTVNTILSEAPVDRVYEENFEIGQDEIAFGVEYLPGQYDQRADSASECIMLLTEEEKVPVKSSKVLILKGNLNQEEINKIKSYYINPVDSREVSPLSKVLEENLEEPNEVEILNGFLGLNEEGLKNFHREKSLAMSLEDLKLIYTERTNGKYVTKNKKIIEKVKNSDAGVGFDALRGEYKDMIKAGIVDPTKVTRSALQNAASVASTFLTTEAAVADIPEKEMPQGAGMGMDGMY